jgi:hypothetical protein
LTVADSSVCPVVGNAVLVAAEVGNQVPVVVHSPSAEAVVDNPSAAEAGNPLVAAGTLVDTWEGSRDGAVGTSGRSAGRAGVAEASCVAHSVGPGGVPEVDGAGGNGCGRGERVGS